MNVLDRIKDLLAERNWTVYRLSKEANIPQSTLANLYSRNNYPTIHILEQICNAFGISLAEFFSEDNDKRFLTLSEKDLLKRWHCLSVSQRDALLALIKSMQ